MGKFHIGTPILQGNALFSGKNYIVGIIFTQPPVVMVAKNFKSFQENGLSEDELELESFFCLAAAWAGG